MCVCAIVSSNGASSLPATPISDSTNMTLNSELNSPIGTHGQHIMTVTQATPVPSVVSSRNRNDLSEDIPGTTYMYMYCIYGVIICLNV